MPGSPERGCWSQRGLREGILDLKMPVETEMGLQMERGVGTQKEERWDCVSVH